MQCSWRAIHFEGLGHFLADPVLDGCKHWPVHWLKTWPWTSQTYRYGVLMGAGCSINWEDLLGQEAYRQDACGSSHKTIGPLTDPIPSEWYELSLYRRHTPPCTERLKGLSRLRSGSDSWTRAARTGCLCPDALGRRVGM